MGDKKNVSNVVPKSEVASLIISFVAFCLCIVTILTVLCEVGIATEDVGYGLFKYCGNYSSGTSHCGKYLLYTFSTG